MEESVFLVKWYGPFTREQIKEWQSEQNFNCSLYLLHGMRKYAKLKESYYCGMTTRSVFERLCDKGHHLEEIENRLNSIYVGCIANIEEPTRPQIMLVEKIITAYLATFLGKDNMLNSTNFYYPNKNVYVINEWCKSDGNNVWLRQPRNAPSNIIPDVLVYHYNNEELYGCRKIKRL